MVLFVRYVGTDWHRRLNTEPMGERGDDASRLTWRWRRFDARRRRLNVPGVGGSEVCWVFFQECKCFFHLTFRKLAVNNFTICDMLFIHRDMTNQIR